MGPTSCCGLGLGYAGYARPAAAAICARNSRDLPRTAVICRSRGGQEEEGENGSDELLRPGFGLRGLRATSHSRDLPEKQPGFAENSRDL